MKVALIGDVHANLPALEAVFDHAGEMDVQFYWNIGDFVGYNAFPDEVVRYLNRPDVTSIIGNYDQKVLKVEKKLEKWSQTKAPEKVTSFLWSYRALSPESRRFLAALPEQLRLEVEGRQVVLVHGSPASIEEHLLPDTPIERMRELAALAGANIVVCGHSHQAFARWVEDTLFINTGSVGRQDDGDPRACYAVLTLDAHRTEVKHYRVGYDIARAVQKIRDSGLPEEFAQMVFLGRSFDAVKMRRTPSKKEIRP